MAEPYVDVHDAKSQLLRLLDRVERGERIVIARAGRPVAILIPFESEVRQRRRPGHEPFVIAPDFDEALPEFD